MLNERHYCTGDVQHNNAYGTGSSTHVLSGFDDLYPLQIIIIILTREYNGHNNYSILKLGYCIVIGYRNFPYTAARKAGLD